MQQRTSHNKTFPLNSLGGETAVLKKINITNISKLQIVYASTHGHEPQTFLSRDCTYQPTTEPDFAINYKTFNTKLYLYIYNSYTCPTCNFQKIKGTHCTDTLNSYLQATFLDGIFPPIKLMAYFMYMKAKLQKKQFSFPDNASPFRAGL